MLKRITNSLLTITDDCYVMQFHHVQNRDIHEHGCFEMIYVLSGSALHRVGSFDGEITETKISIGNYLILDKHTPHGFREITQDFKVINFLFFPTLISNELSVTSSFEEMISHSTFDVRKDDLISLPVNTTLYDYDGRIHFFFTNALSDFKSRTFGTKAMVRSYALQILITVLRQSMKSSPYTQQADETIRTICEYIQTEYASHVTLTELCERMHFNVSYISKKFKKEMGTSFESYLQQTRIRKSCKLLLVTRLSINEIASMVGYSDVHSFRKIFTKIMGTTPSDFRKGYSK